MNERDRLSLRAFRAEIATSEEAEREECERPIREAEAKLHESATALAKFTRKMIASGKDMEFTIPASVAGKRMSVDQARRFNADEAQKFCEAIPDFYPSAANKQALFGYLQRNGINIADVRAYTAAYMRLKEFGLLEDRPEPQPEPQPSPISRAESEQEQPEPIQRAAAPEEYAGIDPATGRPRMYTKREVNRMSSEELRRAFDLYGDRAPRFVDGRR